MINFPLIMLGAMYENGGNTVQRLLDGHPQLFVYPFESQLGTRLVTDHLSSLFPVKYRWPVFSLSSTPDQDYAAVIDEECRIRALTPQVSKFRHVDFAFSDDERRARFIELTSALGRSRASNVEAFFRATAAAWHASLQPRDPQGFVGYSPIITVDSTVILDELPAAHFIHVVRNPWSAFADTKRRPVPLTLPHYMLGWLTCQLAALHASKLHAGRFHIVRFEDVVADPVAALTPICERLRLSPSSTLSSPSWNGTRLREVYPWGTIRELSTARNRATAAELSNSEREAITQHTEPLLAAFGYLDYLNS